MSKFTMKPMEVCVVYRSCWISAWKRQGLLFFSWPAVNALEEVLEKEWCYAMLHSILTTALLLDAWFMVYWDQRRPVWSQICRMQTKPLQPGLPILHPGDRNTHVFLVPSVLMYSPLSALWSHILVLISVGVKEGFASVWMICVQILSC